MKRLFFLIAAVAVCCAANAQAPSTPPAAGDTLKPAAPQTVPAPQPPAQSTPTEATAPRQRRDTRPWNERIDFGFGSAFWITTRQTHVEIAPVLAYRFPKTLITGVGYRYIYRRERVVGADLNAYGPDFFARANLTRRIYLWTEYEILHNEYLEPNSTTDHIYKDDTNTESWFGGIGYIRSLGKRGRGGISFQVLYNFLYEDDDINPYYSPVIYRVGYFF